jgi:hypothetical protein
MWAAEREGWRKGKRSKEKEESKRINTQIVI